MEVKGSRSRSQQSTRSKQADGRPSTEGILVIAGSKVPDNDYRISPETHIVTSMRRLFFGRVGLFVCLCVCLFVCLSFCMSVNIITQKVMNGFR